MKISTGLIILIMVWILMQKIRGVPYTPTETYIFLASSAVAIFCYNKLKDKNRQKIENMLRMNWNEGARLNVVEISEIPPLPEKIAEKLDFSRKMIRIGGVTMHYIDEKPKVGLEEEGEEAPMVLFIHGDPGWCYSYRKVIKMLQKKCVCRCVAVDLIGFGLSERPNFLEHIALRPENQLRIVSTLVKHLNPKQLIIVGGGWGGVLACAVAQQTASSVYGLVLSNTSVRRLRDNNPRILGLARLANVPYIGAFFFRWLNITARWMKKAQGTKEPIPPSVLADYAWGMGGYSPLKWSERCGPLSFARSMPCPVGLFPADFHRGNLMLKYCEDWASRYGMPCELVWGEADPYVGKSCKRTDDAFTSGGARVFRKTLPNVGHFVHEEAPEEIVAAVLRNMERMKQYCPKAVRIFKDE